ncbi:hypothetical protein Tco_0435463 [Tanacetum coccineum]
MKLDELITLCTKLSKQVLDLEKEKDAQAVEILNLKRRVKKLERKSSISHPRKRTYRQVETSSDDDLNEEDASKQERRSDKLKPMTPPTTKIVFDDEDFTIEMARTLIKMKEQKSKEKGVAIKDVEDSSTIMRDQGDLQVQADAELAQRIHEEELAELERAQQERQRQEDDTNATLAKEFDEIQARIDADHELAIRLTHE